VRSPRRLGLTAVSKLPIPFAIGVALSFEIRVKNLRFADGTVVPLPPKGVIVVVGPNSSGKSTLLREIGALLINQLVPGRFVLDDIDIEKDGTTDELLDWFQRKVSPLQQPPGVSEPYFKGTAGQISLSRIQTFWTQFPRLGELGTFLVSNNLGDNRLGHRRYSVIAWRVCRRAGRLRGCRRPGCVVRTGERSGLR